MLDGDFNVRVCKEKRSLWALKSWLPLAAKERLVIGGVTIPTAVGETTSGRIRVLKTAPCECLLIPPDCPASALADDLESRLPKEWFWVDLSDALMEITLRGRAAREVLAKGCGLDFHAREFPIGHCARTRFTGVAVVIDCLSDVEFALYVGRSYVDFTQAWICDAALEFSDSVA